MTEEEKKAIKDIELLSIGDFITWFTTDGIIKMELSAKTVLNLITKLQKENEILKRAFDKQTADMSNNLLELQQKDKIIDLMAEEIRKTILIVKPESKFCQYEEDCKNIRCKDCIKQYFEKQAKEKGKEYEENNPDNKVEKI